MDRPSFGCGRIGLRSMSEPTHEMKQRLAALQADVTAELRAKRTESAEPVAAEPAKERRRRGALGWLLLPVRLAMLLVLPFTFFSSGLIAWLYSKGLERRVLLVTVTGGFAGTAAIVAGQLFLGPTGAGLGYLFRQGLIAAALAGLVYSIERKGVHRTAAEVAPASTFRLLGKNP